MQKTVYRDSNNNVILIGDWDTRPYTILQPVEQDVLSYDEQGNQVKTTYTTYQANGIGYDNPIPSGVTSKQEDVDVNERGEYFITGSDNPIIPQGVTTSVTSDSDTKNS